MDSKLSSIVITSVLAFALIAGIPAVFENVLAQQDGSGQTGGDAGMDQSQSAVDAGMAQTQGNDTGFAQSQPGADMGGATTDQSSADAGTGDNGDGGGDNGDGGGDNADDEDDEDEDNSEDEK